MALNGAIAGLVGITAEPLTPSPLLATIVGVIAGVLVVLSIVTLDRMKIDDPVGAISAHGVCGAWGLIAVTLSNPDASLGAQLYGLAVILVFVFVASFVVWAIIKVTAGIRVSEEEEYEGLDVGECGLEAYPEFTSSAK
jgi:Amt family ammonium transporter